MSEERTCENCAHWDTTFFPKKAEIGHCKLARSESGGGAVHGHTPMWSESFDGQARAVLNTRASHFCAAHTPQD